jgi:hypothetical protein
MCRLIELINVGGIGPISGKKQIEKCAAKQRKRLIMCII